MAVPPAAVTTSGTLKPGSPLKVRPKALASSGTLTAALGVTAPVGVPAWITGDMTSMLWPTLGEAIHPESRPWFKKKGAVTPTEEPPR